MSNKSPIFFDRTKGIILLWSLICLLIYIGVLYAQGFHLAQMAIMFIISVILLAIWIVV